MSVATFEAVVEGGQIKLANGVSLPDQTGVYVVVSNGSPVNMASLSNFAEAHSFVMEVNDAEAGRPVYPYPEERPDKSSREPFIRGRGIRASTIWHDRYIQMFSPEQIAKDRDLPIEAVYDALAFCRENWEMICAEKEQERQWLEQKGFFNPPATS